MFTFSGLIQCGPCHAEGQHRLLVGELKKGQYVYYTCARCRRQKRARYYGEHIIEKLVKEQLQRLHMPEHVMEFVAKALRGMTKEITQQSERDRDRLHDLEKSLRRKLSTAYDDRLQGALQPTMYAELAESWPRAGRGLARRAGADPKPAHSAPQRRCEDHGAGHQPARTGDNGA